MNLSHYNGKFHAEQDYDWESEQCPVTKIWARTKKVLLKTWTIYETVKPHPDKAAYQTPHVYCKNKKEALTTLHAIK